MKVDLFNDKALASDWIQSNFWIPEIKGPIWMSQYQIEAMDKALELDEDGNYKHSLIVWSDIKKSIKCICKDTLIWMFDGSHKRADEISAGDVIWGYSEKTGSRIRDIVSGVEAQPKDVIVEIRTKNGKFLKATREHPVLVYVKGNDTEWIRVIDIVVGDGLVVFDDGVKSVDVVISTGYLASTETIAIEVKNTHTHITNGIVTHNSCLAAAVALWRAFNIEWGSIKVVANDLKQARSRSYYYLTRSLQLNPETAAMIKAGEIKITRYTVEFKWNHTVIEAIPADPRGEAGGNDDMVLFTELWTYIHKAHQHLWTETVIPPNKFGKAFRWAESYAGFSGQSVILESLYQANVKPEFKIDGIAPLYENESIFMMWNQVPRLPWQTKLYYRAQMAELSDDEFRRVHKNEWIGSTSKFINDIWWDSCVEDNLIIGDMEPVVVGVDAAYSELGDYFAIVVVGKHPTDPDKRAVKEVRFWRADKTGKLEFKNVLDEEDIDYPYGYVMDVAERYRVVEVAYDPMQLHLMAGEQNRKKVAFWREFTQGKPRTVGDNELYHAIKIGSISHSGDKTLSAHVKGAGRDSNGRLVKLSKAAKIDGAVALAMAHNRARYYNL